MLIRRNNYFNIKGEGEGVQGGGGGGIYLRLGVYSKI